uniref:Uncharacterized protein n=1 Tax=Populus davidiana TaxID=266767 RepID=A0A6M2EPL0_9ROSI
MLCKWLEAGYFTATSHALLISLEPTAKLFPFAIVAITANNHHCHNKQYGEFNSIRRKGIGSENGNGELEREPVGRELHRIAWDMWGQSLPSPSPFLTIITLRVCVVVKFEFILSEIGRE